MTRDPVFVVGACHSGAELVATLMAGHPHLAGGPPTPLFVDLVAQLASEAPVPHQVANVARLVERWAATLGDDPTEGPTAAPVPAARDALLSDLVDGDPWGGLRRFLHGVFDAYAEAAGAPRWINHTPGVGRLLPIVHALLPGVRVVHVVRDARDVAAAAVTSAEGPCTADRAVLEWVDTVERAVAWGARHPAHYHLVRYEDLVAHPEDTLLTALHAVGAPASAVEVDLKAEPPGRWRTVLSKLEQRLVDDHAGRTLQGLGYEREELPELLEVAEVA